jgi:sugar/nucleoside kinase (ribokinase family)
MRPEEPTRALCLGEGLVVLHPADQGGLVIKSDAPAPAAIEVDPDGTTTEVPALNVDVVEPIGAGDGFAAGYLAGTQ